MLVSSSSTVDGQHFAINTDTTYSEGRPIKQAQYPSIPSANWTFFPVAATVPYWNCFTRSSLPKKIKLTSLCNSFKHDHKFLSSLHRSDWSTVSTHNAKPMLDFDGGSFSVDCIDDSVSSHLKPRQVPKKVLDGVLRLPSLKKLIIPQIFQHRLALLSDVSFTCQLSVATMSEVAQCLQMKRR